MGADIDFPTHLRAVRQARGYSGVALAAKTGLDPTTISRLERGVAKPQPETLHALAAALEVEVEDFLTSAGYMTTAQLGRDVHVPRPDPIQAIQDSPDFDDDQKQVLIALMEQLRGSRPRRGLRRAR